MVATSSALEDMGEHRSPKNTPDRMAPPSKGAGSPAARPNIMQIKPMVLAVPKDVPVRKDIRLQSRKAQRAKNSLLRFSDRIGDRRMCADMTLRIKE